MCARSVRMEAKNTQSAVNYLIEKPKSRFGAADLGMTAWPLAAAAWGTHQTFYY